jgi:cytochrome c5
LLIRFYDVPEVSMANNEDSAFVRQFSGVIAGFVVLTIALIFVARYMQPESEVDLNPSQGILAEQRIVPVGSVRYGEEGAAALAEAQAVAIETAPVGDVVMDGPEVYGGLCKTCHDTGVADAPIPGSEQMAVRVSERGLDGLVQNALNGLNAMPPRGGNPALTDEQIQAAVEFMLQ